jgi:predicted SnoaL-like aldol condensation-catalyzing enzyme
VNVFDQTSPRDGAEILRSLIDAWLVGDALRAAAHFTIDAEYREAGREPLRGRDAIAAHFTRFFRDGPAWRFEVDTMFANGLHACVVYRFAVKGPSVEWRERAGCAVVAFDPSGSIAGWREYEG